MSTELSQERINDLLELQAKLFELASKHGTYIGFRPSSSILEELVREERNCGWWEGYQK